MNIGYIVLAMAAGVLIDRVVVWDKTRAVTEERKYHVSTIRDLQERLQKSNMERFAADRRSGNDINIDDYVYTNPNFERDFLGKGRAKTQIVRVGSVHRGQRRGA